MEYIDIFLPIYGTYRYIFDDISIDQYIDIFLLICHLYIRGALDAEGLGAMDSPWYDSFIFLNIFGYLCDRRGFLVL